jgi:cell division protein DivIC
MVFRKLLPAALVAINVLLFYNLVWSDRGLFAFNELKNRQVQMAKKLDDVGGKSLDLSQEIRWLKSDRSFTEKITRSRMNFLKDNEVLYIFSKASPDVPGQATGAPSDELKN